MLTSTARKNHAFTHETNGDTQDHSKWLWIGILVIVLVAGGIWWRKAMFHQVFPKRWRTVYAGQLYRSGQVSEPIIRRVLEDHHIRVVVDLTGRLPNDPDQNAELASCKLLDIEHFRFPLAGNGTGNINNYAGAVSRIAQSIRERKPVLVHCSAGVNRTGGVLAAYRMLVRGENPHDVYADLNGASDSSIQANPSVTQYLKTHMRELIGLLVDAETIEQPDQISHGSIAGDNLSARRSLIGMSIESVTKNITTYLAPWIALLLGVSFISIYRCWRPLGNTVIKIYRMSHPGGTQHTSKMRPFASITD